MTYVITGVCAEAMDQSCVAVCPVDCIHPVAGELGASDAEQLYIDPDACIDCDACVAACPVDAPRPASELTGDDLQYIEINAQFFQ